MPKINAHAIDVMVILPKVRDKPPMPATKIVEMTYRFLLSSRSTFWTIFRPETAMNPYNAIHTPPMTQAGILEMKATKGEIKAMMMHSKAAQVMVATEAFRVMATQAIDSPYVVFGQPPKKAPTMEPMPSPSRV